MINCIRFQRRLLKARGASPIADTDVLAVRCLLCIFVPRGRVWRWGEWPGGSGNPPHASRRGKRELERRGSAQIEAREPRAAEFPKASRRVAAEGCDRRPLSPDAMPDKARYTMR